MTSPSRPSQPAPKSVARPDGRVEVYTTCPSSSDGPTGSPARHLIDVARWSEENGCVGLLAYTDNLHIDPWLVAQTIINHTERMVPLVAVQPAYLHPYAAAKMAASIALLHGRRVNFNLVTGGSAAHLRSLGDHTEHDDRYDRLFEYTTIVRRLLTTTRPVTLTGKYHRVERITVTHRPEPELAPRFFLSGASPAAARTATELGVTRLTHPKPVTDVEPGDDLAFVGTGIRIGIVARPESAEAWRVAVTRFPGDPFGEQMHQAMARSADSRWYGDLTTAAAERAGYDSGPTPTPYWLFPFRNYHTYCPYLVGSYQEVAGYVAHYLRLGVRTIILDVPPDADDLRHAMTALATIPAPAAPPEPAALPALVTSGITE